MFTVGPMSVLSITLRQLFNASHKKDKQEHDSCPVLLGEQTSLMFMDKVWKNLFLLICSNYFLSKNNSW